MQMCKQSLMLCLCAIVALQPAIALPKPRPVRKVHLDDAATSYLRVQPAVSLLRGGSMTMMALDAFADAEADADQMLMSDLVSESTFASAGGPATLAEYCAGKGEEKAKMGEGTRVKADWNEYGTKYPGRVTDVNKDGTVDIHYNDGFDEKNVDMDDIKLRKPKKKAGSFIDKLRLANVKGPSDDPACKMQEFLKKLQDQLKNVNGMLGKWVGAQRAKMAEDDEVPTPPPSVTAAPPAAQGTTGAPPSQDQAGELEKLKAELGDLDTYIKQLEEQEAKYDKKIQDKKNPGLAGAPTAAPGVKTVDDLIAEYRAKIDQRNTRVKELLQRIKEQKAELARLGQGQLSLKDIDAAIDKLEKEVEEGRKKRDELKKAGDLDPELRAVIDDIIGAFSKMRKKVDNLIALNVKAKEERVKAEQEAKEAALAAKKKAKEEGKNEDEAEAEAAAAAKKAKEKAKKADLDTMNAANEVNEDLKKAEHSATELDTGLHPHGDKWWRYRYERSYIEAMLMCFISFLMLLWSVFWKQAKHRIHTWSLPVDATPTTECEDLEDESIDCMYSTWLHFLADQMLVCIFVFLTVWLIAKTSLVEFFPMVIKPAADLHVPHTGEEYRKMALDICTIFFFAIVFYFGLMFSVAASMEKTMHDLKCLPLAWEQPYSVRGRLAHITMGSMERLAQNIPTFHKYFVSHISSQMSARDDPELKEISGLLNDDFNNFPLAKYLKMTVWVNGIQLFVFRWAMWLPVIAQFMCLMLLHRFAHMGYVRIMGFATVVVLLMICGMGQFNKHILGRIRHHDQQEEHSQPEPPPTAKSVIENCNTENIVLVLLQFSLFFVCYGVARMICQPWMWELHFWPVLVLTIVALLGACLFVLLVSRSIPSFLCAMAMPPYVGPRNTQMMKAVALSYNKPSKY